MRANIKGIIAAGVLGLAGCMGLAYNAGNNHGEDNGMNKEREDSRIVARYECMDLNNDGIRDEIGIRSDCQYVPYMSKRLSNGAVVYDQGEPAKRK